MYVAPYCKMSISQILNLLYDVGRFKTTRNIISSYIHSSLFFIVFNGTLLTWPYKMASLKGRTNILN